jgi:hypothetical protein
MKNTPNRNLLSTCNTPDDEMASPNKYLRTKKKQAQAIAAVIKSTAAYQVADICLLLLIQSFILIIRCCRFYRGFDVLHPSPSNRQFP